jgi:hypothetical protein
MGAGPWWQKITCPPGSDKKTPETAFFSFFRGDNRIVQAGLPDPTEEVFRRFTGNKPVGFYL